MLDWLNKWLGSPPNIDISMVLLLVVTVLVLGGELNRRLPKVGGKIRQVGRALQIGFWLLIAAYIIHFVGETRVFMAATLILLWLIFTRLDTLVGISTRLDGVSTRLDRIRDILGPLWFHIRTKGGTETAEFLDLTVAKEDLPGLTAMAKARGVDLNKPEKPDQK